MSARVLIADPDAVTARRIKAQFHPQYVELAHAASGHETLEMVRRWRPDVVLLATTMADIASAEVCRKIKQDRATCNVLVAMLVPTSAQSTPFPSLATGADDFLSVPDELPRLVTKVRWLVRLKRTRDEWQAREATARALALPFAAKPPPTVRDARVLIIDGDEPEAELLREWLVRDGLEVSAAATSRLAPAAKEAATLALIVGEADQLALWLRASGQSPRPLLLIGEPGRNVIAGANDLISRPIAEAAFRARARNRILYDAYQASLRGDAARRGVDATNASFDERYAKAHLARLLAEDERRAIAVLMIEIDQLARITGSYGHANAARTAAAVAGTLQRNLRVFDTLTRHGQGGFLVIMPGTTLAEAIIAGERLRDGVAVATFAADGEGIAPRLTISLGIAAGGALDSPLETLLERAGSALQRARRAGWNRVESMDEPPSARHE